MGPVPSRVRWRHSLHLEGPPCYPRGVKAPRSSCSVAWISLALGVTALRAQAPLEPPGPGLTVDLETIEIEAFPRIVLRSSILDPSGRSVRGLDRKCFTVVEDGKTVKIGHYELDSTPLAVVVSLDMSSSMIPVVPDVKRAAAKYFRILEPYDHAALQVFAEKADILLPFTHEHDKLITGLVPLRAAGPTALYDAIYYACVKLKQAEGRRALILLTDGQDQNMGGTARQSLKTAEEAMAALADSEVIPFIIGLGVQVNRAELARLAGSKGGLYLTTSSRDLEEIYVQIARTLKHRVVIEYETPEPRVDGLTRQVEIKVEAKALFGSDTASYRAPGRYVVELPGHGYDHFKPDEGKLKDVRLLMRDVRLKAVITGGVDDLTAWLASYYKSP